MGISGLLPLLKSIQMPCSLRKFAGQTIGVDAYGWLHRGTVACAIDLALGKPTRKYVDFSMHRVRMLQHFGVTPYLVFDGGYLPSKAATEGERATRRAECRKRGLELYKMNKPSQAHLELQKAVDVTPSMARELIEELKKAGVDYVVAPYEADAQLVYLEKKGIIQGVLSEDSDLLVFGAKRLLTKLDQYGDCVELERARFTACRSISLVGWSDTEFRRMAILSGCDYLNSIPGMGLKNAYRLVRKYKTIERIVQILKFDSKFKVPPGYSEAFDQAELTFLHQRVYCPETARLVMLTEPEYDRPSVEMTFIGADLDPTVALAVAKGDLDPLTMLPIQIPASGKLQTPAKGNIRHGGTCSTPISKSKGNQTLETFFKAQRTPLAELDPNCFAASPRQQQLLQAAAGNMWEASPTPAATLPRQSDARIPDDTSGQPAEAGGQEESPAPGVPVLSRETRDYARVEGRKRTLPEEGHFSSPFFAAKTPKIAKSMGSAVKKDKKRDTDFQIWSDDSVEEGMSQLPDVSFERAPVNDARIDSISGTEKRTENLDRGSGEVNVPLVTQETGTAHSDKSSSPSQRDVSDSAKSEFVSIDAAETLDKHVSAELALLRPSFKVESSAGARKKTQSTSEKKREEELSCSWRSSSTKVKTKCEVTAPRIQDYALTRSKSSVELGQDRGSYQLEGEGIVRGNPRVPRLAVNHSIGPDASALKGSEDFLVPDVEGEESDESRRSPGQSRSFIDLHQFAFTG